MGCLLMHWSGLEFSTLFLQNCFDFSLVANALLGMDAESKVLLLVGDKRGDGSGVVVTGMEWIAVKF